MRSEILVPDDYTLKTFTSFVDEYEFLIQVEECIVNTYSADQVLDVISYNIGAPTLTSPKYSFVEDPACSYPETVTFVDLPFFVSHNEVTSDLTIFQNLYLNLIGSYTVTIRSEIQIPDDFTLSSFTTMFVEYEFLILIEPCLVSKYSATILLTEIVHNIGAVQKTDGFYAFAEDPICNYMEKVTLTNLPSFIIHN